MGIGHVQFRFGLWMCNLMATKYGKVFTCKKGKYKGKRVKYAYKNGRKSSKKMVRHYAMKRNRRR